ncbi:MAG TPA: protein translocase subunit SecD, partial [Epsilonproteobacteria bacterium]|nr:protein translocase subunit SecD [Campylobacterota bacterium]
MKTLNYRIVIFIFALIFGVVFSIPSLIQSESGKKITLGLDLQGGLHMLLGVKTQEAVKSRIKSVAASLKYILDDKEIIFDELKIDGDSVKFELLDSDDVAKMTQLVKEELKGMTLSSNGLLFTLDITPEEIERTKKNAISQAVDTIRNRLDQFGLAEPTVAKQGEDKILVEVPGVKTPEQEQRIRELIARAAHLQMMAVDED